MIRRSAIYSRKIQIVRFLSGIPAPQVSLASSLPSAEYICSICTFDRRKPSSLPKELTLLMRAKVVQFVTIVFFASRAFGQAPADENVEAVFHFNHTEVVQDI